MATESVKSEKEWEIEDAARTLQKAEEIKKDSKLYKQALAKLQEQSTAIDKVLKGLKLEKVGGTYRSKRS